MKTSTFLAKVLNKFNNGKSFARNPAAKTYRSVFSYDPDVTAEAKGRTNLIGMMTKVAKANGIKSISQYKVALANSLGHTSVDKFAKSSNVKFAAVKAVLLAAIKRERASGN